MVSRKNNEVAKVQIFQAEKPLEPQYGKPTEAIFNIQIQFQFNL